MDGIMKLKPCTFKYKAKYIKKEKLPKTKQLGLIAQDLEKIFPELILTDKNDLKSIDYEMMIPILIKAIQQEQKMLIKTQDEINICHNKIKSLTNKINALTK